MAELPQLRHVADRLGVDLDGEAVERFREYRSLLLAANQQFNLTRITDPDEVEVRLFADSLTLVPHIPQGATRLLDVGAGGGVPGLPLAIVRPDLEVVLLDATLKKVEFLQTCASELGLSRVRAIHGRAEDLGRNREHRERYDVATARAVARLVTLVELTLPFLCANGRAILPKGSAAEEELAEARYAIGLLGGRARAVSEIPLAGTNLVVIDKRRPTPASYPRRTGIPNKAPLLGRPTSGDPR